VVALDGAAAGQVDVEVGRLPGAGSLGAPAEPVEVAPGLVPDRVDDLEGPAAHERAAAVADLAAHLGVERGAVEDDEGPVLGPRDVEHRRVRPPGGVEGVAREDGRGRGRAGGPLGRRDDDLPLLRRAPALALLLHEGLEPGGVDREAALDGEHLGQVQGEAVRVVKLERDRVRERALGGRLLEAPEAALERPAEALLLGAYDPPQRGLLAAELREDRAQGLDDGRDELLEEAAREPEGAPVEGCPAQDAPYHVVSPVVAWEDAVRDRAADAARMVGQDAEGDVRVLLGAEAAAAPGDRALVRAPGQLRDAREERPEDLGV